MNTIRRNYNWDYLRAMASIAVVMLHVSYSYMPAVAVQGNSFAIMAAYNAFTRFAVPVFFMLSGLFLLDPEKDLSFKDCLRRTAKLLVIFYIWSAFYAFQGLAVDFLTGVPISTELVNSSFQRFLCGHGHMWFMSRLAGYYLMLPFARSISADKVGLTWLCVLWMLLRFVIPFLNIWLPFNMFTMFLNQFDFQFMATYFGYLFLGYWLKVIEIPKKIRVVLYMLGISAVMGIFVLTVSDSRRNGALCEDWVSPSSFLPLLCAISIFVFFKHYVVSGKGMQKIMRQLSRYSLLIYILHPFFIEKMNMLGINTNNYNPLWSVLVFTILIVVACVVISWIIERIPVMNKLMLK